MPPPFAGAIGAPAEDEHSDQARHKRNRSNPADALDIRPAGEALKHSGKPEPKRIATGIGEEQPRREDQYRGMAERLPDRHLRGVCLRAPLFVEASSDPIAFVKRQPSRFAGP